MGDFNHPDICWEDHTARHTQSWRFLQNIDDNFLMQVVEEPMRRGILLNLALTKRNWLRMCKLGVAVTMKWWSSGSCMEEAGQ